MKEEKMHKKVKIIVRALLTLLICYNITMSIMLKQKQANTSIDEVKLLNIQDKKEIERSSSFAIMVQQADNTYKLSDSYPTGNYKINTNKSGCMDMFGNKVNAEINYNKTNGSIGVSSNISVSCYFYFDMSGETANEFWNKSALQSSSLENDGKRYFGTNPDNYICFGTNNATTCKNAPDKYMYRIIGVFDKSGTKYLKLIKKEALVSTMKWNDTSADVDWGDSTLYTAINGDTFLNNGTYIPTGWSGKIANWIWTAVNTKSYEKTTVHYYFTSPKGIYYSEIGLSNVECTDVNNSSTKIACNKERVGETTSSAKIGLMNASDYALSLGGTQLTTDISMENGAATLKTGWIHLSNNDSQAINGSNQPSEHEWTISRYGKLGSNYHAFYIHSDGAISDLHVTYEISVRPAFYLNSDVAITEGSGTVNSPYIIG